MRIKGGNLAARIEAVEEKDFIYPAKRTDCAEIIEGACLDFYERQVFTVASQLIIELETVQQKLLETKGAEQASLQTRLRELSDKYSTLSSSLYSSIQDRLNLWGISIGIGSHFKIVIPEDKSKDIFEHLASDPSFIKLLQALAKKCQSEPEAKVEFNVSANTQQKNFHFQGKGSNLTN